MFNLAQPWLLLLLVLPWVVRYLIPAATTGGGKALWVPFLQRRRHLRMN